eukprot:6958876-Pyramimonas_sp.AAC.1
MPFVAHAGFSYALLGNPIIARDFLAIHAGPTVQQPACSTSSLGPFPTCPLWVCPPDQPVWGCTKSAWQIRKICPQGGTI